MPNPNHKILYEYLLLDDNYTSIHLLNFTKSQKKQEREKYRNNFYNLMIRRNYSFFLAVSKYAKEYHNRFKQSLTDQSQQPVIFTKHKTEWEDPEIIKKKNKVVLFNISTEIAIKKRELQNYSQRKISELTIDDKHSVTGKAVEESSLALPKLKPLRPSQRQLNWNVRLKGAYTSSIEYPSFLKYPTLLPRKDVQQPYQIQQSQKENQKSTRKIATIKNNSPHLELSNNRSHMLLPLEVEPSKELCMSEEIELINKRITPILPKKSSRQKFLLGYNRQFFI